MTTFPPGYLVAPIIAACGTFMLLALLVQAGIKDRSRRLFLLVLVSLELWSVFTLIMRSSRSPEIAVIWARCFSVAGLFLFLTFLHFCHMYLGHKSRWPIVLLYALFTPSAALILGTDLVIQRLTISWYGYAPVVGRTGFLLYGVLQLLIIANLVRLMVAWRRESSGEKRRQYLALAVGGLLPILGSAFDGFTNLPPMAVWTNLAFCTVCTVAILRLRLFDLHVLARKGLVHFLVSTLVATPYVGAMILFLTVYPGQAKSIWTLVVAILAFALLLRPAYEWARLGVERLLYRERYDHLEALRNLIKVTDSVGNLDEVGSKLTELVGGALRASSVFLLQTVNETQDYFIVARDGRPTVPPKAILSMDSPVVEWLKARRGVLSAHRLAVEPVLQNIPRKELDALSEIQSTLLVPLLTQRGNLSALLILGPKDSHRSYSKEDVQLLESLGAQAALSLENTRLYRNAIRVRETLQAWLNNLPDAIVIVDQAGTIRFLNRHAAEQLGQQLGQQLLFAARSQRGSEAMQRFIEIIREREYEIAPAPFVDPDGLVSVLYVMRDITERKEEQAQRERLETKARMASHLASIGEMASGIAHEINNPLTAVIGYSQLLGQYDLPTEVKDHVEQILQGATRVAGIVQRLLTFARQRKPARGVVDLNEVVRSTFALREYALKIANIRVVTRLDPHLPATIADGQQLQQVILNLIINAETAMKGAHRGGELVLSSAIRQDSILLTIADDGPGIPSELQDRIFDPFFTTQVEGQGTGLGLSICHGIVHEHGGRIWVQSEYGKGASFLVELPIVREEMRERESASVPYHSLPRMSRILVVDDEPAVLRLLQNLLQQAGHRVEVAQDGRTALELISKERYGLILLDVRMPEMSGIEVYEKAIEVGAYIADRIIFLTGDVMALELQGFIERTGVPFLTKPFKTDELLQVISQHLDS